MGKKKAGLAERSVESRRLLIEPEHPELSIVRQCELLAMSRSGYYYEAVPESAENLALMRLIDEQYNTLQRRSTAIVAWQPIWNFRGIRVNDKRVRRRMRLMGIEAIYQKPRTSIPNKEHSMYPYLLMERGFLYLVAVMDWYSRYVLSWRLSNTMDVSFCREALNEALERYGTPEIFNSDQGSQFTSPQFTSILLENDIAISMDGKGRAIDNVFLERLWRSVKYECLYLHRFEHSPEVWDTSIGVFRGGEPRHSPTTPIIHHFAVRRMGRTSEYHLQKYYCQRNTGIYIQHRTSYSTPEPHYCTPDGFAINDELAKPILMELKISSYFSRKKLACAEVQCQYTMHLLNLNEAMICILQGTKVDLVRIPRDREEGERLYALARSFWDNFVVKGIEP
ncbi:MAG: IS3 family transposase [Candidatus Kapaibacterium sp.]|nr:MAG: IS3 family transposase [Candidatus Kapabacteria bacterium]